jgi:RND family efflux transporter MFP subunit
MASKTIAAAFWTSLILAACNQAEPTSTQAEDRIPVRTLSLMTDTMSQTFNISGQFTTDDETLLSFKTGGVIQKLYVEEGDPVRKGQLLATLNLTEVNAAVAQAKLGLQKAERDYERANRLYLDSVATLEQMQNAKTALELARQQYASVGFNQQYSEIRATQSGYVLKKFANEGQITGPGNPVFLINGASDAKWRLKVGVSDRQWAAMQLGDPALVSTELAPGKEFAAKVLKKSEGLDPQTGTFQLLLELENLPRGLIASGLFGKAKLYPRGSQTGWAIPFDALLDGDAQEAYVFITNDGKTAQKQRVEVGRVDKEAVWIESGLENARALIISGSAYLNHGSPIKVLNEPATSQID